MPTLYTLEETGNVVVSNSGQLDGVTQGDGTHLLGQTITLLTNNWTGVEITDSDGNFEDNDSGQTLTNSITYDGESFSAGQRVEAEYRVWVIDPNTSIEYELIAFNIVQSGAPNSYGTVEGLAFVDNGNGFPPLNVDLVVDRVSEGPTGGATSYTDYSAPPCFVTGTMIATDQGLKLVENLCAGDLVETRDAGHQSILWVGQSNFSHDALVRDEALRPVRINAGVFGPDQPDQDLLVSPQHRLAVGDWRSSLLFGEDEVLVAAKHLVNGEDIAQEIPQAGVSYFHVLLDGHHMIKSNGVWSESFQPGPQSLQALSADTLADLLSLLDKNPEFSAVRRSLKSWEGALLKGFA